MIPLSPAEALGSHTPGVRDVLVEVVRSVHGRFAEAHLVSSRGMRLTSAASGAICSPMPTRHWLTGASNRTSFGRPDTSSPSSMTA